MVKKRKPHRAKSVKQRKYHSSIVVTIFLVSSRLLFWIARRLYFSTRKNSLFFIGSFLFALSFVFVSFNALFSQMKFIPALNIEKNSTLLEKEANLQAISRIVSVSPLKHSRKNFPSLSENTLQMQKKLAKLGLYDGPLDGIEGPKTRRAIALWKQQSAHKMQNSAVTEPITDEIAVLIERNEIEMANETTKAKNLPRSKETFLDPSVTDITKVQKALRMFGNQEITVSGVEDQKTVEALKQFQKMFELPITGKVDHAVLMKMREVGLLN
ncbi:peptidoglycan-binding domain-containing protein [Bartonella doshiae]|uniref:peptidoglycan-binding domain-containing protein n=1 Tax=Bartonella doshiae TaxID=33044 RepID=UPI0009458383|nr:peptidoglycan-binding domain-containing protein [Bartonella doshiae]